MNLLLDTCALLALAADELHPNGRAALQRAPVATIPPIVPWELGIKVKTGKLVLPAAPLPYAQSLARRHGLVLAPAGLDAALLCAAADLPLIHRDPIDRILIALGLREGLAILTSDRIIPAYPGVKTLW